MPLYKKKENLTSKYISKVEIEIKKKPTKANHS
jgi:hypothetical protein